MGRCEMVWTTAGTNRVCGRCMELKDTVVGYTDQSGVTLPPLHPRCRCAIMYREVGTPRAQSSNVKPAQGMSADDMPKWAPRDKSKIISKEEYAELRNLAAAHGISLIGVKNFDDSSKIMRETIETLIKLKEKFPAVSDRRHRLELEMSILLDARDYAITKERRIQLNAAAYRDVNLLTAEYQKDVADGWFVKGTTWRAIIHHEFGHVVANVYKLAPLKIACEITGLKPVETLKFLGANLSKYAGLKLDGSEIISEVFADISTGNACDFSRKFYDKVLELTR